MSRIEKEIANKIKPITLQEAKDDYQNLRDIHEINIKSNIGNKATNFLFFVYRLQTQSRSGISFFDFLRLKIYKKKEYYQKWLDAYGKDRSMKSLYTVYTLYTGSGTIPQFKPIVAKFIYQKFQPKCVLDPTCGWGGRCLGAMSMDIDYIGFDTNINLKPAYKKMIQIYSSNSNVKIYFKDSAKVNYTKFNYDMVFTSPPYYNIEQYKHMPEYKNREHWVETFLNPMIEKSYQSLQKQGTFIININKDGYEDIKKILGACNKKIPLRLKTRQHVDKNIKTGYDEMIYIWFK